MNSLQPPPDYVVIVNRAWKHLESEFSYQVFGLQIEAALPCISVPLRENIAEVLLDLQYVMNRTYDRGPYRRGAVDYRQTPKPRLRDDREAWLDTCLQKVRADF